MKGTDPLVASVRIAASPSEVFAYFVDPALLIKWIGEWADLEAVAGGTFAFNINETRVRGRFTLVEPPHRLVFTWGVLGDGALPEGSTTVEILLTADGAETIVELAHRDLPQDQVHKHRSGWTAHLDQLKSVASRH